VRRVHTGREAGGERSRWRGSMGGVPEGATARRRGGEEHKNRRWGALFPGRRQGAEAVRHRIERYGTELGFRFRRDSS
jgi:hypothetical protein